VNGRVAAIVGPTAVGKTDLSLLAARSLNAEIVSIDSMQIYRGMDIGTAKPGTETRHQAPHHLIDVFDPDADVTVSEFQDLARAAIAEISSRALPLLVGGSGLYFRAVVDPIAFPPRSAAVRDRLEGEVDVVGPQSLHDRLKLLDPEASSKIEPNNARRTIRALEVIEITGRKFSDNDSWDRYDSIYDLTIVGLSLPRDLLFERIEKRVDDMVARGLVKEARHLEATGMSRTARQALGYRQVLDRPDADSDEIRDAIVTATKRFARRQESWFRADPRVDWFDMSEPGAGDRAIAHLERALRVT
jgi:tRNA dimethylallyltransferase